MHSSIRHASSQARWRDDKITAAEAAAECAPGNQRRRVAHIRPLPLRMLAGDIRPAIVVAVTAVAATATVATAAAATMTITRDKGGRRGSYGYGVGDQDRDDNDIEDNDNDSNEDDENDEDNNYDNDNDTQQLHKYKKITLYAYFLATHFVPQKRRDGTLIHQIST